MANIYSLQLLRNGAAYATKDAALTALHNATALAGVQNKDGVAVLARYLGQDDGTDVIKTLVGYWADNSKITGNDGHASYMTVIDVDGAAADVEELRQEINAKLGTGVTSANTVTEQLTALSGDTASTSADTSVEGAKRYADDLLDALDYTLAKDDNKVVVSLNQTDGAVTAESVNITSVKLNGYAEAAATGDVATTDTLGEALGKLQKTIHEMDLAAVGTEGSVITSVSEADGVVSASATPLVDVKLNGFVADSAVTGDVAATDDVELALNKLQNKIQASQEATTVASDDNSIAVTTAVTGTNIVVNVKSGEKVIAKDGNAGLYTDLDLVKITTGLPETVKERYQLLATDDSQIGVNIDVPKDSHIVSINYITTGEHAQNLEYVYIDVSGNTQTTYVDMSELVIEAEFQSGVTSTNHVVHGVVDPTSESFFTVGADGFKVAGISAHVQTEIEKLDASVTGGTTAGTATSNHIQVVVDEADGKLTAVTVTETNIADKSELDALSAKTFTVATSSNASITTSTTAAADGTVSVDLITDASKIKMSGFTADTSGFTSLTQDSSVTDAVEVIETNVVSLKEAVAALESGSTEALEKEIEERRRIEGQSGSAYTPNASSKYISGATSLNDADVKLAAAIDNIQGNWVEGVKVNGVQLPEVDNNVDILVEAASGASVSDNAIVITQDNTSGKLTFSLGTLDAGVY